MNYELLIKKAKNAGFEAVEIYATQSYGLQIAVFSGEVEQNKISDSKSFTIRGIYNNKMTAYTTETASEDLDFIISRLKENAAALTTVEEFSIFTGSPAYPPGRKPNPIFNQIPISDKIDMLKTIEKKVKEYDPRIVQVSHCQYSENLRSVEIVNSYGLNLKKQNQFAYIIVQAVVKENEQTQAAYEIASKLDYRDFNSEDIAKTVAKKAIEKLNAKPAPSKSYPIIFENEAMSDLISTFVSIFSGEAAVKKITPLLGKEGEQVFGKKVTFIDNPLLAAAINYQPFDDEGVASYSKNVIAAGVFKTFLHNLKTAKFFKTKSTGNGYKMGTEIGVHITNFCLTSNEPTMSKREMISGITEGLLITDLAGLHSGANPINGDFSAQASGFFIENGKIVRPVTLIVVSGNFIKMMNQIDGIGDDFKIFHNDIGTPSVKIAQLPVSGL
ncbi:MAG: TldD/PmbA family protein [Bacilli bacterium]|nr:TldD/PmbA family protein [Bacilli bacterium]